MRRALLGIVLGVSLVGGVAMTDLFSQEDMTSLPTLLIKGEVIALEPSDQSTLLTLKDRYSLDPDIYLSDNTKVLRGAEVLTLTDLSVGMEVEVEYDFDINTAKRYALSVKVPAPEAPAAEAGSANSDAAEPMNEMSQSATQKSGAAAAVTPEKAAEEPAP